MNSGTYHQIIDWCRTQEIIEPQDVQIDEKVPDNLVRLAGGRYVTREQFQRMLRREQRRK